MRFLVSQYEPTALLSQLRDNSLSKSINEDARNAWQHDAEEALEGGSAKELVDGIIRTGFV